MTLAVHFDLDTPLLLVVKHHLGSGTDGPSVNDTCGAVQRGGSQLFVVKRYFGNVIDSGLSANDTCSAVQRGGSHTGVGLDTPLIFTVKYYLGNGIHSCLSGNDTRSAVQRGGSHTGVERE